jgi:asparagine synthase (glutamine-hydrolysing)
MGLKPLCYAQGADGAFYFASEPKALVAARVVRPVLNYAALSFYLANQTCPGTETLFEGVSSVPPGHALVWQDGRVTIQRLEQPALLEPGSMTGATELELTDRFASLFREAVRWRLGRDVAPGILLSGSLGSAVLLSVLHELVEGSEKTFSVTFAGEETEALELARLAAHTHDTEHHELVLSPEEFFASLPTAIWHQDAPIAHPSRIALYHAAALASAHVGDFWSAAGCDELFASHPRYLQGLAATRMGRVRATLTRLLPIVTSDVRELYLESVAVFGSGRLKDVLTGEARERGASTEPYDVILRTQALQNGHHLSDHMLDSITRSGCRKSPRRRTARGWPCPWPPGPPSWTIAWWSSSPGFPRG